MKEKAKEARKERLMPKGVPRYIRCYDDGGKSADRYTVVFSGRYAGRQGCDYLTMSAAPFHPQGVGMHGWSQNIIDVNRHGFAPAVGAKNHLGKHVEFSELPKDCQSLVLRDYKDIWGLE